MSESQEDYLLTILRIERRQGEVRQVDLARELELSKPSVCTAVRRLHAQGLVELSGGKKLPSLTAEGRRVAEAVDERHRVIARLLTRMGAPPEAAEEDACRLEHVVSDESAAALRRYMETHDF